MKQNHRFCKSKTVLLNGKNTTFEYKTSYFM